MTFAVLLLLSPFIKSIFFVEFYGYTEVVNYLIVFIAIIELIYILIICDAKNARIESFYVYMLLFCFLVLPVGLISGSQTLTEEISFLLSAFYHVVVCVVTGFLLTTNAKLVVKLWCYVICTIAVINALTVLLFPEGLYSSGLGNYYTRYWLLGYDNQHVNLYLFGFLLLALNNYIQRGKIVTVSLAIFWILIIASSLSQWTVTSFISLIVFGILIFFNKQLLRMRNIFNIRNYIVLISVLMIVVFIVATVANPNGFLSSFLSNNLGKDITFNSRGYIWSSFFQAIAQSPIAGYGFQSLPEMIANTSFAGAHNEWLQMIYEGGLIHFCFYLLMLYAVIKRINQCSSSTMSFILSAAILSMFIVEMMVPIKQIVWMLVFVLAYNCESLIPKKLSGVNALASK